MSLALGITPDVRDVFCSAHLHVRAEIFDEGGPICVFFATSGQPREPGSVLSQRHRLNIISVMCVGSHWYQYPETPVAQAALKEALRRFPRIIFFGGSMGGYGALHWSGAIDPHMVLAFSPQVSIAPGAAPLDDRWAVERDRISAEFGFKRDDLAANVSRHSEILVVFDPWDKDGEHVEVLEAVRPVGRLVVPFSGHDPIVQLASAGLMSQLIQAAIQGGVDTAHWRRLVRERMGQAGRRRLLLQRPRRGRAVVPPRGVGTTRVDRWPDIVRSMRAVIRDGRALDASRLARLAIEHDAYIRAAGFLPDMMALAPMMAANGMAAAFGLILREDADRDAKPRLSDPQQDDAEDFVRALDGAERSPRRVAFSIVLERHRRRRAGLLIAAASMFAEAGDAASARSAAMEAGSTLNAWDGANLPLAKLLFRLGEVEQGSAIARRVIATQPAEFEPYALIAGTCEAAGDWMSAAATWREALKAGCAPMRAGHRAARALLYAKEFRQALDVVDPLLAAEPGDAGMLRIKAQCHQRLNELPLAATAYRGVLALVPRDAGSMSGLSAVLSRMNRLDEALDAAQAAVAEAPGNERFVAQLDALRQRMGETRN